MDKKLVERIAVGFFEGLMEYTTCTDLGGTTYMKLSEKQRGMLCEMVGNILENLDTDTQAMFFMADVKENEIGWALVKAYRHITYGGIGARLNYEETCMKAAIIKSKNLGLCLDEYQGQPVLVTWLEDGRFGKGDKA